MQAIPRQLADGLPEGAVRYGATVESAAPGEVVLAGGERLTARSVVVAADGPEAARLTGALEAPAPRAVTTLHYAAERSPVGEPLLVLNGEGRGPVNDLCVPSDVAPSYAPPGAALVSATVLGIPALTDGQLDAAVREQLRGWFGAQVQGWRLLRALRIPFALPAQPPAAVSPVERPVRLQDGLFVCGDHRGTASIQGAMVSGRRAAAAVRGLDAARPPAPCSRAGPSHLAEQDAEAHHREDDRRHEDVAAVPLHGERDDGPAHAHERRRDEHEQTGGEPGGGIERRQPGQRGPPEARRGPVRPHPSRRPGPGRTA